MVKEARMDALKARMVDGDEFAMYLYSRVQAINYSLNETRRSIKTWGSSIVDDIERVIEDTDRAGDVEASFGFSRSAPDGTFSSWSKNVEKLSRLDGDIRELDREIASYLRSVLVEPDEDDFDMENAQWQYEDAVEDFKAIVER